MNNEFDEKARTWDENPVHMDRSLAIAQALVDLIPLNENMKALEFGAGTGILSFLLMDKLSEITLIDSSQEMINVTNEKIKSRAVSNMKAICWDIEHEDYNDKFDIIYNQMVLHHTNDIELIISKFFDMLVPGGYLVIADLYNEDGFFHDEGFNGHKGFDPMVISDILFGRGFKNIWSREVYNIKKTFAEGYIREYPVFILTAQKN
jgi:ubiquinone/menaquinone biosynthesis C-methylase UbiE